MLYETLSQPQIFFSLVCAGILCGFVFDLKNIVLFFLKRSKKSFWYHFGDFLSTLTLFVVYFCVNLRTNFGILRFYSIFVFILSFFLQRFLIRFFFAKPISKCYNKKREKKNENKMVEKV